MIGDSGSDLQKPSKFAVSIWYMNTFFPFFIITKCTYNITKRKKTFVNVNSCINILCQNKNKKYIHKAYFKG